MKRFEVVFLDDHGMIVEQTAADLAISPADLVLHLTIIGLAQLNAPCGRSIRALRNQVLELAALRNTGRINSTTYSGCLREIEELDDGDDQ